MGQLILFAVWLVPCVMTTVMVHNHGPSNPLHRVGLYLIIWLLPFFGAVIAAFVVFLFVPTISSTSHEQMFEAIVEKKSEINNS